MSSIFLSTSISIELFLELFLLLILSYTFIQSIHILKLYKKERIADIESFVEKKSYLLNILVSVSFIVKIILVAFFVYALDALATIVPGAMCVTGVLNTSEYGEVIMFFKLAVLLLASLWLIMNKVDVDSKDRVYFKRKMWFFIAIYILVVIEFILSIVFLSAIDTQLPVSCCSSKFVELSNPLPFGLTSDLLVGLFYTLYIVVILSGYKRQKIIVSISASLFVVLSFYAIMYYFSGYIYGVSSHQCSYCILKQEYNFIGYFIYISLFVSVMYTLGFLLLEHRNNMHYKAILWFSIFVAILSSYLLK